MPPPIRRRICPTTISRLAPATITSGRRATGLTRRTGYYWVPGAWVLAPYVGALWTPGYWGFYGGRYHWYHGYWGAHVGFYGGVHYGFGYDGNGYEGGYWRSNAFYYNTAVSRVNEHRDSQRLRLPRRRMSPTPGSASTAAAVD